MGFTTPWFALSAILPIIVILYYFFRKKYEPTTVSSTLFWQEIMRETKVSPYFQQLQKNSLLVLQVIALLLFVLALMQPYNKKEVMAEEHVIFIVDTSATVAAGDTFNKHKAAMQQLVEQMNSNEVTIITTGATPQALAQRERNTTVLHQHIEQLAITYEAEHMEKALAVAQSYVGQQPTVIYIFSDDVDKTSLPIEQNNLRFVVKGSDPALTNIALRRFAITKEGDDMLALVQLTNESQQDAVVPLTITNDKGSKVVREQVAVKAGETVTTTYEFATTSYATALIDSKDDYSVDNQISAIYEGETLAIQMQATLHELLIKGMQAVATDVKITATPNPSSFLVTNETSALANEQRILLFGRDDVALHKVQGSVSTVEDSLFSFSTLEDIVVQGVYPPIEGATTLATVGDEPLIQRTKKGDIVVLTTLEETDWAMYADFPLFLWSVQNMLVNDGVGSYYPNQQVLLTTLTGDVDIYQQDNYVSSFVAGEVMQMPMTPGIYQMRQGTTMQNFVVQLQPEERTLPKGTTYAIGEANQAQGKKSAQSIVPFVILPIILLMMLEWEVQRRRGFTN